VLSERALSVDEALAFILQACEAIAAAHSVGVVHRDLKPSNLFVTQRADGSPLLKVLDFGIAKALDVATSGVSLTRTGTALGSPIYMSPEQVRNAKSSDRRTDVWGIGAVLYELLSNQPPFDADTVPAICAKIVADEPEPLCAQRPDISPDLEAVVARCMRKCPDDRYPDIGALADALLPFASPDRAAQVERIRRIVDGASSLPSASASWNGRDSLADTVSSTRGAALGTLSSDAVAVTIDERAPATSWQRRAIVPAMLMLLALVVVALRSDDDARHAQPWPAARIAIAASTAVSEAKSIVADAPTADDEAKPMIAPAPAIAARRARRTVASTARPRPSSIAAEPPHENDDVLSARK
jgi:serine/threonine-protein kinase